MTVLHHSDERRQIAGASMIYHYPLGLGPEQSGSQVHITQMLRAFEEIGYAVEPVMGVAANRRQTWQRLAAEAAQGRRFDFVYAWSPTVPTWMIRRNLLHPFADVSFFRWCRARAIPSGLFYGDVHYRLDHFKRNVPRLTRYRMQVLYRLDWLLYRNLIDHLFLPSLRMAAYLPTPWASERMSALLPGCKPAPTQVAAEPVGRTADDELALFYVGGVVPPLYDLKPMIDSVSRLDGICLTICCREAEWAAHRSYYGPLDETHVSIVHVAGSELEPYYAAADLFCLFWWHPYLEITMPVKVFEALGYGLPLVVRAGSEAARFVATQDVGWVVSDEAELRHLLQHLRANRQEIAEKRRRVEAIRLQHTWQVRARQVADTLLSYHKDQGRRCDV